MVQLRVISRLEILAQFFLKFQKYPSSAGSILPGPNNTCHFSSMGTISEKNEKKKIVVKVTKQQPKEGWRHLSGKISLKRLTNLSGRKPRRARNKTKRSDGYRKFSKIFWKNLKICAQLILKILKGFQ